MSTDEPPSDCLGGPADLLGPGIARCPTCDYVFVTVMDEPTLSPHTTRDGWTRFPPLPPMKDTADG